MIGLGGASDDNYPSLFSLPKVFMYCLKEVDAMGIG